LDIASAGQRDGGLAGWLTVLGHFITYFIIFGVARVLSLFVIPFQSYFSISLTTFSLIPAVAAIGLIFGALFGGPVIEKYGPRNRV